MTFVWDFTKTASNSLGGQSWGHFVLLSFQGQPFLFYYFPAKNDSFYEFLAVLPQFGSWGWVKDKYCSEASQKMYSSASISFFLQLYRQNHIWQPQNCLPMSWVCWQIPDRIVWVMKVPKLLHSYLIFGVFSLILPRQVLCWPARIQSLKFLAGIGQSLV